jgi:hypothetical protein
MILICVFVDLRDQSYIKQVDAIVCMKPGCRKIFNNFVEANEHSKRHNRKHSMYGRMTTVLENQPNDETITTPANDQNKIDVKANLHAQQTK